MTATVVLVPVVLLAVLFVVQFALAAYARQVLAGAAQDGAAAGARRGAQPADGKLIADQLIVEAAPNLLEAHTIDLSVTSNTVTVEASGQVVSLLPFLDTITVRASSTATIERFEPQGDTE